MIKNTDIKVSFGRKGFKYFIGYENDKKLRPLCILLLQMSGYRRDFNETKYMSFLRKDNELLEKYTEKFQGKSQQ